MTFSTLLEESYTPTRKKPWQGIWVGDYSGHGCEFLLVLQRDVASPMALSRTPSTVSLPRGMAVAVADADMGLQESDHVQTLAEATDRQTMVPPDHIGETAGPSRWESERDLADQYEKRAEGTQRPRDDGTATADAQASSTGAPSGRLESIKLTVDVNVPR